MITLDNGTITVVKTRLDTRLDHYIDEVNGEVEDGFTIEHPQQILAYPPPASELLAFPTFAVMDGGFQLTDDTGWGATGLVQFHVLAFEQHADQETLAWRLRRYAIAVARCILEGRMIDPMLCSAVQLVRADPGPTLGVENPKTFISMRSVTFACRSEQDTP